MYVLLFIDLQQQSSLDQDQSVLYPQLSTIENPQVSISHDNIESSVDDIISDSVTGVSSDIQQLSSQNILYTYTSEVSIQAESDILDEITSRDENLSIAQSTILISDDNLEISSTAINTETEESSDVDNNNIISTPGKW